MTKGLERALIENGYRKMIFSEEQEGYRIYYDIMQSLVNAVIFVDAGRYNADYINSIRTSLTLQMGNVGYTTHYMTVVCVDPRSTAYTSDLSVARQVCSDNAFSWIYDVSEKKIMAYENQVDDFYGLKRILESASEYESSDDEADKNEYKKVTVKDNLHKVREALKVAPKVTLTLIIVNVIVFIICTLTGSLLYNKGAVGLKLIEKPTDIYRSFTSMFLHVGFAHLSGNMLLLFLVGNVVEREVKPVAFTVMYFVSGLVGDVVMFIEEIVRQQDIVVVGASGAVFGLLGVLLALVVFKRVSREKMSVNRVLYVIVLSIYNGYSQANVANGAHIGGVVAGFIMGVIFCLVKPIKKGEKPNED